MAPNFSINVSIRITNEDSLKDLLTVREFLRSLGNEGDEEAARMADMMTYAIHNLTEQDDGREGGSNP